MRRLHAQLIAVVIAATAASLSEAKGQFIVNDELRLAERDGMRLTVTEVRQNRERMVLRCKVENEGSQTAYCFNLLYRSRDRDSGQLVVDPNLVYVDMDLSQRLVTLSKKAMPVPPDRDIEQLVLPCLTRLRPGESWEETLSIALPLKAYSAYAPFDPPELAPEPVPLTLAFELGYFFEGPDTAIILGEVDTTMGERLAIDTFDPDDQPLLRVGFVALRVPCLVPIK